MEQLLYCTRIPDEVIGTCVTIIMQYLSNHGPKKTRYLILRKDT